MILPYLKKAGLLTLLIILSGCAVKLHTSNMSFKSRSMSYESTGKSVLGKMEIDGRIKSYYRKVLMKNIDVITTSLNTNIQNTNLFVIDSLNPDYTIKARMDFCNQFVRGLDCGTNAVITYSYLKQDSLVFKTTEINEFYATFNDAVVGAKRCRLSMQGAIRENMESFLIKLNDYFIAANK